MSAFKVVVYAGLIYSLSQVSVQLVFALFASGEIHNHRNKILAYIGAMNIASFYATKEDIKGLMPSMPALYALLWLGAAVVMVLMVWSGWYVGAAMYAALYALAYGGRWYVRRRFPERSFRMLLNLGHGQAMYLPTNDFLTKVDKV